MYSGDLSSTTPGWPVHLSLTLPLVPTCQPRTDGRGPGPLCSVSLLGRRCSHLQPFFSDSVGACGLPVPRSFPASTADEGEGAWLTGSEAQSVAGCSNAAARTLAPELSRGQRHKPGRKGPGVALDPPAVVKGIGNSLTFPGFDKKFDFGSQKPIFSSPFQTPALGALMNLPHTTSSQQMP